MLHCHSLRQISSYQVYFTAKLPYFWCSWLWSNSVILKCPHSVHLILSTKNANIKLLKFYNKELYTILLKNGQNLNDYFLFYNYHPSQKCYLTMKCNYLDWLNSYFINGICHFYQKSFKKHPQSFFAYWLKCYTYSLQNKHCLCFYSLLGVRVPF